MIMTITTKLSAKDYTNASLAILWQKLSTKIVVVLFSLVVLLNLFVAAASNESRITEQLPLLIIFLIFSLVIYYSIKRAYSNNKRVSETITYHFKEDTYTIKGESFTSELTWNKVQKVTITKNWLLLWQTRSTANAIPRRDIDNEILNKMKTILAKHKVKNNL
jgi:uncharacterized membrane protein YkvI